MARPSTNPNRRADLKAARRRAKPDHMLRLEDLARLWGVSKPAFVNELNRLRMQMDFPEPVSGPRNTHIYPARASIDALIAWETRNDAQTAAQHDLARKIIGGPQIESAGVQLTPAQIIAYNRAAAETEAREREQGLWIRKDEGAAWAGRVFGLVSDLLSNLDSRIDPNGRETPAVRGRLREEGRKANLEIYNDMRKLFDVDDRPSGGAPHRPAQRRSRRKSA